MNVEISVCRFSRVPANHCMKKRKIRILFTLTELLIVILIIGLLASMLLPALNAAREKAQSSQCINNLKQTGLAHAIYAGENQGFIPLQSVSGRNKTQWAAELWGENADIPKTAYCPSLPFIPDRKFTYGIKTNNWGEEFEEYYNGTAATRTVGTNRTALNLHQLKHSTQYFYLGDSIRFGTEYTGRGGYCLAPSVRIGLHLRHTDRVNLLFAAGNVSSQSASWMMNYLKRLPAGNDKRTGLLRMKNYEQVWQF